MTDRLDVARLLDALPFALMPEAPDVGVAGVRGLKGGMPVPQANLVGLARLGSLGADAAISAVQRVFSDVPYTWVVGPESTPADLGDRLLAAGLSAGPELEGLVFADWDHVPQAPAGLNVRPAAASDVAAHAEALAAAYGMGMTAAALAASMASLLAGPLPTEGYLVWPAEAEAPVGFGTLSWLAPNVALLNGSATVPPFRGRGAYRALAAARLDSARQRGAAVVLVAAVADTAAPICRRLGFSPVCRIRHYLGNGALAASG